MTSTPVSGDVTGILMNVASQSVQRERTDGNFSDVLQKQSGAQKSEDVYQEKGQVASRTKVKDNNEGKIREKQDAKPIRTQDESTKECQERALEEAEKLAGQLLAQISEELGMSMEEVEAILGELGMQPTDLLGSENLMQFLLAAGGEADSLSLLTNGKLYETFQNLNRTLEEGMKQIQEMTGMDADELMQLLETAVNAEDGAGLTSVAQDLTEGIENTDENKETLMPERNLNVNGTQDETKVGTGQTQNENPKSGDGNLMNHQQNLFAQNQQNTQAVANLESAIPTESYFSADTQMIMNQIMDFMKVNVGDGLSQLEMQLHPESLGTLQINLASKEGVITAHFTTENEVVKEALEGQMIQLKETFKEQGIRVESIEVSVQTNGFERNLEQGRQNQPGESADRRPQMKVRRLNIRELEDIPVEELSVEEKLAAEMMEENGNTVDYTA